MVLEKHMFKSLSNYKSFRALWLSSLLTDDAITIGQLTLEIHFIDNVNGRRRTSDH